MRGINIFIILIAMLGIAIFSLIDSRNGSKSVDTAEIPGTQDELKAENLSLIKFESHPVLWEFVTDIPSELHLEVLSDEAKPIVADQVIARGMNYAGKFSLSLRSCGPGCQLSTIVDMETGYAVEDAIISTVGISFSSDSRLLIINPHEETVGATSSPDTHYYTVNEVGELQHLIKQTPDQGFIDSCGQIDIPATNPYSGESRNFSSPCSIPYGWEHDF